MARITDVSEFFGLEATEWIEARYGDVEPLVGESIILQDDGSEMPFKIAKESDTPEEKIGATTIQLSYIEVVVTASISPPTAGRASQTGGSSGTPGSITISQVLNATEADMLPNQPTERVIPDSQVVILPQEGSTLGMYSLTAPTTRQKRPTFTSFSETGVLPGLVVFIKYSNDPLGKNRVIYAVIYRPGAPEE